MKNLGERIKKFFAPNSVLKPSARREMIVIQVILFILAWYLSGFKSIPTPEQIWLALNKLFVQDELMYHLSVTILWNAVALLFTGIISTLLAYSTVLPFMKSVVNGISRIRFMGLIGWLYLFIKISPSDSAAKMYLVLFSVIGYMVASMASVVASVTKGEKDYCRTLKMNELEVVWHSTVLGKRHEIIEAFRSNAAMGLLVICMLEMSFKSQGGIGVLLSNMNKSLNLEKIFALQCVLFVVGFFQDQIIAWFKKIVSPYASIKLEGGM